MTEISPVQLYLQRNENNNSVEKKNTENQSSIFQKSEERKNVQEFNFSAMDSFSDEINGDEDLDIILENPIKINNNVSANSYTQEIFEKSPNDLHTEDEAIRNVQDGNIEYSTKTSTDADGNTIEEREYANGVKYKQTTRPNGTTETYIFNPETGNYVIEKKYNYSSRDIYREIGNENTGEYESEAYQASIYNDGTITHTKGNHQTGDYESITTLRNGSHSIRKGNENTNDIEYHYYGSDGSEEYELINNTTGEYEYYDISPDGTEVHKKKNRQTGDEETHNINSDGSEKYQRKNNITHEFEYYEKDADGNSIHINTNTETNDVEGTVVLNGVEIQIKGNESTGEYELTYPDGTVVRARKNPVTGQIEAVPNTEN